MITLNKLLAATLATCLSVGAFAQTVDELVVKHVAALGGAEKLAGVKTLVTERTLSMNGMDIPGKTTVIVGKAMRSEMSIMGNSVVHVIDGVSGWMIRPTMMGGTGDPEPIPADMIKQQIGQLDPFGPLVGYKEKGSQVELVGKETVDGKDAYHLKVTGKDGQVVDEFLDATTYLVSKVKQTGMDGKTSEVLFSDYKETDGIKFPKMMEIVGGQMGTLTFITDKVKVNPSVDENLFKKTAK
ncbi:outer membrane lipoprotein-sorting protein [Spirosoma aerophilum]